MTSGSTLAAAQSRLADEMAEYKAKIMAKIRRNIVMPPDLPGNPAVEFDVTLLPGGDILDVKMRRTSGYPAFDSAVERGYLYVQAASAASRSRAVREIPQFERQGALPRMTGIIYAFPRIPLKAILMQVRLRRFYSYAVVLFLWLVGRERVRHSQYRNFRRWRDPDSDRHCSLRRGRKTQPEYYAGGGSGFAAQRIVQAG